MPLYFQKLLTILLLGMGVGYLAPWLMSTIPPEPADEALLLCGAVIVLFIVWLRLNDNPLTS